MEENKTIKMNPEENKGKKPTVEELTNALNRMHQENQYLRNEIEKSYKLINQLNIENGFKRLDCLFKSLEYAHYFDDEYINNVIEEIKNMIVIKDEEVDGSENDSKKEEPTDETADQ